MRWSTISAVLPPAGNRSVGEKVQAVACIVPRSHARKQRNIEEKGGKRGDMWGGRQDMRGSGGRGI
jgi:hypothetical protein